MASFLQKNAPVRLRLQRQGRRHRPHYRIVSAFKQSPRDGKHLEILGTFDPLPHPETGLKVLRLKEDRVKWWITRGAQPTPIVARLLGEYGLLPKPPRKPIFESGIPRQDKREHGKDPVMICRRLGLLPPVEENSSTN